MCVTIFSTGGKFRPVSIFYVVTRSYSSRCSYALLVQCPSITLKWNTADFFRLIYREGKNFEGKGEEGKGEGKGEGKCCMSVGKQGSYRVWNTLAAITTHKLVS